METAFFLGLPPPASRSAFRSAAQDLLDWRDGTGGWKPHRAAFRTLLGQSPDGLQRDIEARLGRILMHAYQTVPYHRTAWQSYPLVLDKLPFMSKDIVKQHLDELKSERGYRLDEAYTGGTTGTQTKFYRDKDCTIARVGRQWGILEACGYRRGMRRALLWGVHTEVNEGGRLRSYAENQDVLACGRMSEEALLRFYIHLQETRPPVLYGYPSAMAELGQFILDENLPRLRFDTIISTAERLTEERRSFLSETFGGGEVFNLYCTREYGCVGFECREHHGLHIDVGSIYVEIVKDGEVLPPSEVGEIVITDLLNRGMPMIRNRTADMGSMAAEPCSCGSPLPRLLSLDGRSTDVIRTPDGSTIAGLMLTDAFSELKNIRQAQFVQNELSALDVHLVVTEDFGEQDAQAALKELRELVGEQIELRLKKVPQIERNPRSGKYPEVISRV